MLTVSKADVVAEPFPHVAKEGILPVEVFDALRADFPDQGIFEGQRDTHGKTGSRTGSGFDLYRGDDAYRRLVSQSEAWREFDAYINSERFTDTFRDVFADHLDSMGLRIDLAGSRVEGAYHEPRELLNETATAGDRLMSAGLKVLDRFRDSGPVPLFTRLDIHRSFGGYQKPPHCDRPNRLCSLIIYFTDADAAGLEGGELLLFKHRQDKPVNQYERHPSGDNVTEIARLKTKPNLGVFFPCQNNSYHGVTEVLSNSVARDFLYINISGRSRSLW